MSVSTTLASKSRTSSSAASDVSVSTTLASKSRTSSSAASDVSVSTTLALKRKRSLAKEGRQYNPDWEQEYFCIVARNVLVCTICNSSISAMKEYNVKRHYNSVHKDWDEKYPTGSNLRSFKLVELKNSLAKQQDIFTKRAGVADSLTEASYKISWELATARKPFVDGDLIKRCLNVACETLYPNAPDIKRQMNKIPLSRCTVASRIEEASIDIERQIKFDVDACKYFSLALDESTDVSDFSQLAVFIRFIMPDFKINEELLGLVSLKDTTTGKDIKSAVVKLLDTCNICPAKLSAITTDGAPAMCGRNNGAIALLRSEPGYPDFISYHCILHQQVLCAKHISLKEIMSVVVDIVCFIRARALNHRQFKMLLQELDSENADVLLHAEIRWLSRAKVLVRFVSCCQKFECF